MCGRRDFFFDGNGRTLLIADVAPFAEAEEARPLAGAVMFGVDEGERGRQAELDETDETEAAGGLVAAPADFGGMYGMNASENG